MVAGFFALLGVVVGLVAEQVLRRKGVVRLEVEAWAGGSKGGPFEERHFEARFFNDRDVNISLWDPRVEFYEGGQLIDAMPTANPRSGQGSVGPIDLPSRTSVYVTMALRSEGGHLTAIKQADRVSFAATIVPSGKKMEEPLPPWDPFN